MAFRMFPVRRIPNTQRAPPLPPRSSQDTLLCSARVLITFSNHAETIRGYVRWCSRELVFQVLALARTTRAIGHRSSRVWGPTPPDASGIAPPPPTRCPLTLWV